ncbi:MAG: pilus assembly protein PilM [Parcubacteria group bacterium]
MSTKRPANKGRTAKRRARASSRVVGLDLGASSVKLAEVEHGPLGCVVRTFGIAPYLFDRNGRADLVKTLEQLVLSARVTTKNTILTLPQADACVLATGHDAATLQSRLNPRLAAAAVCWPVGEQLVTLPRWIYDFYNSVVQTAGLTISGVQYVPSALGRSVMDLTRAIVLDLGAGSTAWYIFDHGELVQRVNLPYGGEALTQALALAYGWTRDQAEDHKRSLTGDPQTWPEESALVVRTFLERWWSDLHEHLAEQPAHVQSVLFTGGGSRFVPLREFVFEKLGLLPQDWQLPLTTHVAEPLRPYLEPHLPVLANSLAHLVY